MSEKPSGWVAPVIHAMLSAPPLEDTSGPITCPVCECEHQVFQGMGTVCPGKDGTRLTCCFPSVDTIVSIDLPHEVAGMLNYVRYSCRCGGHSWAEMTAFHIDHTVSWCIDLSAGKSKKCGKPLEPATADAGLAGALQSMTEKIGQNPVMALVPGEFGPGAPPVKLPPPQLAPDHEDPLVRLPSTVRYVWNNWPNKKLKLKENLPRLPAASAGALKPPHLAVGTDDKNMFHAMQDWLFALSVEIKPESKLAIHALVYWSNLLIVVSDAVGESRRVLTKDVMSSVIVINRLKPDIFMLDRKSYTALVKDKVAAKQ